MCFFVSQDKSIDVEKVEADAGFDDFSHHIIIWDGYIDVDRQ